MLEEGNISLKDQPEFLNMLGKMCRRLKTIPDSMHIADCASGTMDEEYSGGCGTVSRGEYRGRPVAIKTLHFYFTSDFEECFGVNTLLDVVSSPRVHPHAPPLEISQRSCCLEAPTTPKHLTVYWCKSGAVQARDGIRVDGPW